MHSKYAGITLAIAFTLTRGEAAVVPSDVDSSGSGRNQ